MLWIHNNNQSTIQFPKEKVFVMHYACQKVLVIIFQSWATTKYWNLKHFPWFFTSKQKGSLKALIRWGLNNVLHKHFLVILIAQIKLRVFINAIGTKFNSWTNHGLTLDSSQLWFEMKHHFPFYIVYFIVFYGIYIKVVIFPKLNTTSSKHICVQNETPQCYDFH